MLEALQQEEYREERTNVRIIEDPEELVFQATYSGFNNRHENVLEWQFILFKKIVCVPWMKHVVCCQAWLAPPSGTLSRISLMNYLCDYYFLKIEPQKQLAGVTD